MNLPRIQNKTANHLPPKHPTMSTSTASVFLVLLILHSLRTSVSANDSSDILYDISPFIRVYTNGTIQRFIGTSVAPPFTDPVTRVRSKDIVIDPKVNVTARLYLPGNAIPGKRIPLLVYFHGGAFFTESAASPPYHRHLNSVVGRAKVVAVSVNYRLAPENPLPVCYEDSWLALNWVFSQLKGYGKEPWIKNYVDFRHVHVGGDSAGANIAHNMAIRAGSDHEMGDVILDGLFLNCPHFWGEKRIGNEDTSNIPIKNMMESIWVHAYPNSRGLDDPLLNPASDPNLSRLGCRKVLVYVAGKDILRGRGWYYKQALRKSGWRGRVKVVQVQGEEHDFGVRFPDTPNAVQMLQNFAAFLQLD